MFVNRLHKIWQQVKAVCVVGCMLGSSACSNLLDREPSGVRPLAPVHSVATQDSVPGLQAPVTDKAQVVTFRADGNLEQAIELTEALVGEFPADCELQVQLGVMYRQQFRFEEAATAYQHCLAADPTNAPALLNLGILHELYLGQPADAANMYRRYLAAIAQNLTAANVDSERVALWVKLIEAQQQRDQRVALEYRDATH